MLTSLKRMVGLPVVWQDKQLGYVERAIPNALSKRLSGVVVRKGIGAAKWAAADDILLVGAQCVLLGRKPSRMPESETNALGRAFLTSGESAGEVTDVVIQSDTFRVAALELSPGPVYRLMGMRSYAAEYRVEQAARQGEVVVPQLLTWAQLRRKLGEEAEG